MSKGQVGLETLGLRLKMRGWVTTTRQLTIPLQKRAPKQTEREIDSRSFL